MVAIRGAFPLGNAVLHVYEALIRLDKGSQSVIIVLKSFHKFFFGESYFGAQIMGLTLFFPSEQSIRHLPCALVEFPESLQLCELICFTVGHQLAQLRSDAYDFAQ